jgi:hypothetical protein
MSSFEKSPLRTFKSMRQGKAGEFADGLPRDPQFENRNQDSACRYTAPFQNRGNRPLARSGTIFRHFSCESKGVGTPSASSGTIIHPSAVHSLSGNRLDRPHQQQRLSSRKFPVITVPPQGLLYEEYLAATLPAGATTQVEIQDESALAHRTLQKILPEPSLQEK